MREVTSKDGLGVGIIGLGVMYAIYPWASSEMAGDAAFGMLSGLCSCKFTYSTLWVSCPKSKISPKVNGSCSKN